jgi:cyanophycin synthetase
VHTIEQLIEEVNKDPRRGVGHEKVMTRIKIDAHVREFLERSGLTVESVPEPGQTVVLRATANLSTGGTAVDRTNEIHPDNAEIARRAAAIVGLDIAGIDFIAPDIAKSVRETGGGIIELNAAPGFRMHLEPSYGPPRDVARPVIDMLFPRSQPSRVPIFAITGTNGKSTVGRMVKQVLRYTGANVGLTSTSGVYVNGVLVASGDATGPKSARIVLRDPSVDIAVLETARGGILREGLAFTDSDVGVVLNVTADHLGLKGIETLDDLANVKSLIVETVHKNGTSVLNADDPLCVRMAKRAGGRLAWFSLNGGPDEMPTFLRRPHRGRRPRRGARARLRGRHHRLSRAGPARGRDGGRRDPRHPARHGDLQHRQCLRHHRHVPGARRAAAHHPLRHGELPVHLRAESGPPQRP